MKFVDQTIKRVNQNLTKAGGLISLFLWLLSNLELNVKNQTIKMSVNRSVFLDMFGVLHSN